MKLIHSFKRYIGMMAAMMLLPTTAISPLFSADAPSQTQPLTLEECYQLALVQSELVAIQEQAIKRAEAQIFNAASQGLGDVNFVMTRQFQDITKDDSGGSSIGGSFSDPDRSEKKFTISQPLFQGFKAMGALSGAGSYTKEQKQLFIRAKQLLYADVAKAFYTVLGFRKDILILDEIHEFLKQRIDELKERERIGRSRASEVLTAQARLKQIEADLANTRKLLAVQEFILEFLTGADMRGRELKETEDDHASQDLNDYLKFSSTRSDVIAAEQAVKTAKRGILVAQSGFWPQITLDHNQYMRREGFQNKIDWDTLFTFNLPLFSGTETIGQVKDSLAQLKQKKLSLSLAERTAILEIKQSFQNWISSKEQLAALKETVKASDENYKAQVEEYRRSLVNNLDVLAALESLQQAMRQENLAYYQVKNFEAELKVAIGEVA